MRILFIVPYAPSLIRVRPYQFLRALARRGNHVTLATLWSSPEEMESLKHLAEEGIEIESHHLPSWRPIWNCLLALPGDQPLQAAYCWHPGLARAIGRKMAETAFDAVHVEHLRGARFGLAALVYAQSTDGGPSTPVVWDSVDCISHLFGQAQKRTRSLKGRWMTRLELERTRRHEGRLVRRFDRVTVTSPADRDALLELAAGSPGWEGPRGRDIVKVVPNGVDLEYFRPPTRPRDRATLVFSGKMSYHANITAVIDLVGKVMPLVWRRRPDVDLLVVGKDPSRAVRALAQEAKPGREGRIEVTGTVDDLRPFLHRATLAVAPLPYGAGIQNKVLEAMACATPVVAGPRAVAALNVRRGHHVIVADTSDAFAEAVVELLDDAQRRRRLGAAGRTFVSENHDWKQAAARLEACYLEAAETLREMHPHAAA